MSTLHLCIFLLILLLNPFFLFAEFMKDLVGTPKGEEAKGIANLKRYLSKLGYISNDNRPESNSEKAHHDDLFDDKLEEALKKYQAFFGLQVTGVLDEETMKELSLPRCGFPDIIHDHNTSSSQLINNQTPISTSLYAFSPDGAKWPFTNLTYSYDVGTHTEAKRAIKDAFDIWATTTGIFTFTKNNDSEYEPDITISFKRGDHGDGSPFYGRGGILAHSARPTYGIIHLDDEEDWTDGVEKDKFDLLSVLLHEVGHALGLDHSKNRHASMYPHIKSGKRKYLHMDDIDGMIALYKN